MRQIFEKNMRIMNNLLSYCHELGGTGFEIQLEPSWHKSHIRIRVRIPNLAPAAVANLRDMLALPRQPEVEQNYWYLGGESELEANLSLAAAMTDEAMVDYDWDILTLYLVRKE